MDVLFAFVARRMRILLSEMEKQINCISIVETYIIKYDIWYAIASSDILRKNGRIWGTSYDGFMTPV